MKGKNTFTSTEVETIKQLINKKVGASKSEQKRIRDKIRNIGFYFSDYNKKEKPPGYNSKIGYTVADFEWLIIQKKIKVQVQ